MSYHLFGNIITNHGITANNRGENESNVTTLQKLWWNGEEHTTLSAEAIRWSLRYYWQLTGEKTHRIWNQETNQTEMLKCDFDPETYIDDDVLGFMAQESLKSEEEDNEKSPSSKGNKKKKMVQARGALDVSRAISTEPFKGEISFNASSGEKNSTSLYGTEMQATRYQFGFALTPEQLKKQVRVIPTLEGLTKLPRVAGNNARFLFDFSPDNIVLRWCHDFVPRILYIFEKDKDGNISVPKLIHRVTAGDISPEELYIGGTMSETPEGTKLKELGCNVFAGVVQTTDALVTQIKADLGL